ncbi:SDR family NAD(P)-dependent oxidoreductase [Streptacidiphilus fuscans]|uniref:SDR family oxidoreductase n=1 Tax=Streptacidiphilus fuscans TaxID=2789292 RepID=A0A931B2P6_9ACTN|nr:SDR family oxidoreductase [Streptacidiphilus fuscans]MBF9069178.1 SDR family oxidoreductase [Streptacidiphilus fuscans]
MSDRVALVAGAGGVLGRAVAVKLADAGFTVVGIDRNTDGLAELPDGIHRVPGDVTDPAVPKGLVDRIAAEVGAPDVLVNTLGAFVLGDALATTPDELRLMMDVNLGPALWLTQAVAPHMRERGSGAVVHVSARPAAEPTSGMAAYSLSKAALNHLVRVLDLELRPHGIRVNAVAPQLIDTPKNRSFLPPDAMAHAVTPEAVAELIVFLAGDRAAPVSGAILPAYGA